MPSYILTWWATQMRTLLFGAAEDIRRPDGLVVAIDHLGAPHPTGLMLLRRHGTEELLRPLAEAAGALPRLPAILRLPPGIMLSRTVSLPLAAAQDLATAIAFEMDRLTPFSANQVFWSVSDIETHPAQAKVTFRLLIVLQRQVDGVLAFLAARGLTPRWIEGEGGVIALEGARGRLSLLRSAKPLHWLCLALVLLCIATPILRQELAIGRVDRLIQTHQAAGRLGEALLRRIAIANASRRAIAEARAAGEVLQVLASLTEALPDGTWLDDLALRDGDLTMDGHSSDAPQLIGLLSAVPLLRSPSFTAPVTRSTDNKTDQFSLHATVAP